MTSVATQTVLRLDHVSKTYGEGESSVEAVHDVSLDLEAGKFIFLMGPSGSGKTTLLMLMGCLLRPTAGSVHIFDEEVSSLAEARLPRVRRHRIGYIFQGFNLFPALTALENVEATLNLKGLPGRGGARGGSQPAGARRPGEEDAPPAGRLERRRKAARGGGARAGRQSAHHPRR